jgi:integrase
MSNREPQRQPDARPKESLKVLREILSGRFAFSADLPISASSKYGDSVWSWVNHSDARLASYNPRRLTIDWTTLQLKHELTGGIVEDLRKYAFLRYAHSKEVFAGEHRNDNAHPVTVVNEIDVLTLFLSHLRSQLSSEDCSLIHTLADIEAEDLENALSTYTRRQLSLLKRTLTYLCSPNLGLLLDCGPLKWNRNDVKALSWNIKPSEPYGRLPDELFRFLSNTATADVKLFLRALGVEPEDTTRLGNSENYFLAARADFAQFYEEYVVRLTEFRGGTPESKNRYWKWLQNNGAIRPLTKLIDRACKAAQLIVAMYSSGRLSELNSFERNCLRKDDDGWFIVGTHVKGQGRYAPALQDKWVAIPIMRDAVRVLEQTARLAGATHLIHTTKPHFGKKTRPLSGSYSDWFEKYLGYVDTEGRWKGGKIHVYMLRHTLVFQMRRAGLNLPFITYQLKHVYDALHRRINNVTIAYGGLDGEAARRAIEDANMEAVAQVYHPDAPVAGGGAEQHKARRAAFFAGMALQGVGVDEILRRMSEQGMPLTDMGHALCQGQRTAVSDGIKQDPPCIGQLRCNPLRCPSAIIPKYKRPAWEEIAQVNRQRASDPEFAHAWSYFTEAASEAEAVVRFFREAEQATEEEKGHVSGGAV